MDTLKLSAQATMTYELMIALENAGFTTEKIQEIINAPGNKYARSMYESIYDSARSWWRRPYSKLEDRNFRLEYEIKIDRDTMPGYLPQYVKHITSTDWSASKGKLGSDEDVINILAKKCAISGRRLIMRIYKMNFGSRLRTKDFISFIKKSGGILPSLMGVALADISIGLDLPRGVHIVGMDEKGLLPVDKAGNPLYPYIKLTTQGSGVERGYLSEKEMSFHFPSARLISFFKEADKSDEEF